jgi:DNA polymerase IV (DinB-like DNA polymerase)
LPRVIGHFDLDYFYAQVEEVEDHSLRERPVIVCVFSGRTEDSGAVATSNYKARELGVRSGMPIVLAKKKLEGHDPAVVRMMHEKYEAISERIMTDLEQMVDVLEPTGIDEAFFDLTESSGGDYAKARGMAESIKESVYKSEHLTCSMGLGRSKVVAKLGSDAAKPAGLTVIHPESTAAFLDPLPVNKLYGVGPKTTSVLDQMGIKTVRQLADADATVLERRFGKKFGAYLTAAATGTDDDPVVAGREPTQFSRIVTLERDTRDAAQVVEQLSKGIEYLHGKLASSAKSCKTVSAIVILTDLSTKTKSMTFEAPIDDPTIIKKAALALFEELGRTVNRDFRRVGIRVSGLTGTEDQTSLSEFVRMGSP